MVDSYPDLAMAQKRPMIPTKITVGKKASVALSPMPHPLHPVSRPPCRCIYDVSDCNGAPRQCLCEVCEGHGSSGTGASISNNYNYNYVTLSQSERFTWQKRRMLTQHTPFRKQNRLVFEEGALFGPNGPIQVKIKVDRGRLGQSL